MFILSILALECIVEFGKRGRFSSARNMCPEARAHVKVGYGNDLPPVLKSLDLIEQAQDDEQMKQPIETIEKILDLFGDIDIGY